MIPSPSHLGMSTIQLLLLVPIPGLGKKHDVVPVSKEEGFRLLCQRRALCATENVLRRYGKASPTPSNA